MTSKKKEHRMLPVSEKERLQINQLVARFESATGVEAVAAVTEKADAYPEIPWKAFALGAVLGGLLAAMHPTVVHVWSDTSVAAFDSMTVLGTGVVARGQTLQYANELFLEHELFRTHARRAVLIVVCRFERLAVVVADSGLSRYAPPAELSAIGDTAGALARRANVAAAFELALDRIEALLAQHGMQPVHGGENELETSC
jgi:putative membrane protein